MLDCEANEFVRDSEADSLIVEDIELLRDTGWRRKYMKIEQQVFITLCAHD